MTWHRFGLLPWKPLFLQQYAGRTLAAPFHWLSLRCRPRSGPVTENTWLLRYSSWGWEAHQAVTAVRAQGVFQSVVLMNTRQSNIPQASELPIATSTVVQSCVGSNPPWATGPCHPPGITQAPRWQPAEQPRRRWWPRRWLRWCLCCLGCTRDRLSEMLHRWAHAVSLHGANKSQPPDIRSSKRNIFPWICLQPC